SGDETTERANSPVRVRARFQHPVGSGNGTTGAVAGVFARCDSDRSRMARKSCLGAKIGRRTSAADEPGARRSFLTPGAFCSRITRDVSTTKRVARACYQRTGAGVRSHLEEAPQRYSKRHD